MRLINLGALFSFLSICLLIFSCSKNSESSNNIVVSTFAGSGVKGILDGVDTSAEFSAPYDIAIDENGNLYVSEVANNCIRKISPSGVVSTFAGSGIAGYANGQGKSAQFNQPAGLAVDVSGNIFVADYGNNCIRKISPSGLVSTFSGNGIPGFINGPSTVAEFWSPFGVAVDENNYLYVTDAENGYVRKITPDGTVSSLVYVGTRSAYDIDGIAVNREGYVFISDFNKHIFKITPSGKLTTFAGNDTSGLLNGQGTAAKFFSPAGICTDNLDNIYVTEVFNNCIRKISPSGYVTTIAGSGIGFKDGPSSMAKFNGPRGVVADSKGNLYITDQQNFRIRKISTK